jgi:hypothetical protein
MDNRLKLLVVGLLFLMAFVGVVSASTGTLTLVPDNQVDCSNYVEFKIDTGEIQIPIADGLHCKDGRCVTLDFYRVDGLGTKTGETSPYNAFDFKDANFDVHEVIIHGGPLGCNVYSYAQPVRADTFLTAPFNDKGDTNPNNDVFPDLSYIKFCVSAPEFPTPVLPMSMLIGVAGVVYLVRKREN